MWISVSLPLVPLNLGPQGSLQRSTSFQSSWPGPLERVGERQISSRGSGPVWTTGQGRTHAANLAVARVTVFSRKGPRVAVGACTELGRKKARVRVHSREGKRERGMLGLTQAGIPLPSLQKKIPFLARARGVVTSPSMFCVGAWPRTFRALYACFPTSLAGSLPRLWPLLLGPDKLGPCTR